MTDNELRYIEMVLSARHSGNLDTESWETSILGAFSWSGRLNSLGASLIDWLDGFKNAPRSITCFLLATELVRMKTCSSKESVDIASDAMRYYENRNCPKCEGRGVIDQSQTECPFCRGSGRKDALHGQTYQAYKVIEATLEQMDMQLKARMRYCPHPPSERTYKLSIHHGHDFLNEIPATGQVTPIAPYCP